ncbi:MAG: hypothetical protein U0795_08605 [Pirellulales bacterium]
MNRLRTIDYAARAVQAAIVDKYRIELDTSDLRVEALDDTIRVAASGRDIQGTRDELMAAIRQAASLDELLQPSASEAGRRTK